MSDRCRSMILAGLAVGFAKLASVAVVAQTTPTPAPVTASAAVGCVSDYDASAGVDYFEDKAELEYAESFTVSYQKTYKLLNITGTVYVLYQCGTPQPVLDDVEVQQYISVPVTIVATGTPDHIPRIELLGHRDSIVAYTSDTSSIGSPCVDALVADGTVVEATTSNSSCGADVDNDVLVDLGVEVAFGDSLLTGWCSDASPVENGVAVQTYMETGSQAGLAHGEAIKLFSLFYNEEAKGNEIFEEIKFLWFCTKNNAQGCSLRLEDVPEVAWFPYLPTDTSDYAYYGAGSGWGAPNPDAYYAHAVNNTGGAFLSCDSAGGLMTDEEMLACFANATVCVFAADYAEVEAVFDASVLNQLACVQNDRVYDITLSGVNAWFEAITVEPHVLMEDMVVVLHGEDYDYGIGSYERLLLRDVALEESESGTYYPDVGTCEDTDAELEIQGECDIIVDFVSCDGTLSADEQGSPASRLLPSVLSHGAVGLVAGTASLGALFSALLW